MMLCCILEAMIVAMPEEPAMSVYHPDPVINAQVIADTREAEIADLTAGYPPRRWRCTCGAEHSRGHFSTVGIHRCLACGYTGPEGIILDDGED